MRLQIAKKLGVVAVLGAFVVTAPANTIKTLSGRTYEVTRLLKKEADGITVKHRRGIAKIAAYELSSEVQKRYGIEGEVRPKIRHSPPPSAALLTELDEIELDPDAPQPSLPEPPEERANERQVKAPAEVRRSKVSAPNTAPRRETVVHKVEVQVSAVGCAAKPHGLLAGPVTTKYTPYGNYSYYGKPHPYLYFNGDHVHCGGCSGPPYVYYSPPPPNNRRYFDRRDFRRWQGNNRGRKASRFPFAHFPH